MRYCITGGSGFIGGYFCRELAKQGHQITVLDLIQPSSKLPHDRYVKGDIRDESLVADCLRDIHSKHGSIKFLGSYPAAGDRRAGPPRSRRQLGRGQVLDPVPQGPDPPMSSRSGA